MEREKLALLFSLQSYFTYLLGDSVDEVYLKPRKDTYTVDELLTIIDTIGELAPDEISGKEGMLRLWWD